MNNRCARAIGGPKVENHHAFSIQLAICHALQPSELTVCSPDLIIQSVVSNFLDTIGHLLPRLDTYSKSVFAVNWKDTCVSIRVMWLMPLFKLSNWELTIASCTPSNIVTSTFISKYPYSLYLRGIVHLGGCWKCDGESNGSNLVGFVDFIWI